VASAQRTVLKRSQEAYQKDETHCRTLVESKYNQLTENGAWFTTQRTFEFEIALKEEKID
jgi:hypothetical protein